MPASKGRPKSFILDLYGAYIRRLGGWMAVSDLVALMGQLGVDEQAVRSAVSRMTRRGLLVQQTVRGARGYRLSAEALLIVEEGDRRIFSTLEPARLDDGWIVVTFSIPEEERDRRHVLRSRLSWMGFGMVANGVWMAPRRLFPELRDAVERLGFERNVDVFDGVYQGFEELDTLVRRCWDLDGLREMYREFLAEGEPVRRWASAASSGLDGRRAFADYTLVLDRWRRFPYLDPGLPAELLPRGWEGRAAAHLFFELRERLEEPAMRHVERTASGSLAAVDTISAQPGAAARRPVPAARR
jgi:phenylacetic acid degradation operon negative regulatory protein